MEVINSRVRDSRSILLFGIEGQRKLRSTSVVVAGVGGLGSAVVEHLALLGVAQITTIDNDELDETNRNRFIGARASDRIPGTSKVLIADRLIKEIDPDVRSIPIKRSIVSLEAFEAVRNADWTIGCFDDDGPRAVLNEVTAAYAKPSIDLASDVPEPGIYGGRVCVSINGDGCLDCLGLLDRKAVRRFLESPEQRAAEDAIYGISAQALEEKGPSVSPINGVVAAIGAVEFMVAVTGLRPPTRLQEYRAHLSKVVVSTDEPRSGCHRCKGAWNSGSAADVERYLRLTHLANQ